MARIRERLPVDERRAQLLEFGVDFFSRHAFDEMSIDEVAVRAGVSKGLLYHYFGSKRGFYVATIKEVARRVEEAIRPSDAPFEQALEESVRRFVVFVGNNAAMYRSLVRGGVGWDREVSDVIEAVRLAGVAYVLSKLGLDEPPPSLRIAIYGWVGFAETACLEWSERRQIEEADMVAMLTDTLLGLLSRHLGA